MVCLDMAVAAPHHLLQPWKNDTGKRTRKKKGRGRLSKVAQISDKNFEETSLVYTLVLIAKKKKKKPPPTAQQRL